LILIIASCSTTKNLPAGEVLYNGIRDIDIIDKDSVYVSDNVLNKLEDALAYPPNNALLGSSSKRTPFPLGLWVYNANVNKKGTFSRWMMNWLAAKPVLISTVKPETRARIAQNVLRENGFFNGVTGYGIIPDKKDSLKAKVYYEVTLNEPYVIDSVEWRRMQHRADTLLQLNESERLIRKGDLFSTEKLEAERQRITTIMRNNGYYYFRPEYIVYQADSTLSPHKVSLKAGLKQGTPRSILRPWKIGDISIHLGGYDNELPTDSIYYKDLLIYYEGKLRVRPSVLYDQFQFQSGDLYSLQKQTETQIAINRLDNFRFTEFQYTPKDTLRTCDTMNLRINMSYDYPLSGVLEMKATVNDDDYAGPGVSLSLIRRNLFGGGEVLTSSVYGLYEWNTGKSTIENTGYINNYEVGVKADLAFPRLVLPRIGKRAYDFSATTHLTLGVSNLNRARYYRTLSFGGSLSYEFQPSPIRHHSFTAFKLVFDKLQSTTEAFDAIDSLNPSLYQSMEDQFIPSIGYTYTLDNSSLREGRSTTWWRFSISEAGNLVSGVYAAFGRKFDEKGKSILGNPYNQFLKATTELRYNHYIDRNQRLAMRIGGGVIYSYGNSVMAPYSERFYVGGANSIRAFTIRSIGPGRFRPDPDDPYAYLDQNGDWKLEANIEYRRRLVGKLEIATFLDAGNIWLMREDETRPGGTFQWKHFGNDMALGTGIGFRYDMNMLVFRVDFGYALHFPYDTRDLDENGAPVGKKKYFNTPSFWDGVGFHIALGYPF
jgi:outer membrane protein assembly factor BamA